MNKPTLSLVDIARDVVCRLSACSWSVENQSKLKPLYSTHQLFLVKWKDVYHRFLKKQTIAFCRILLLWINGANLSELRTFMPRDWSWPLFKCLRSFFVQLVRETLPNQSELSIVYLNLEHWLRGMELSGIESGQWHKLVAHDHVMQGQMRQLLQKFDFYKAEQHMPHRCLDLSPSTVSSLTITSFVYFLLPLLSYCETDGPMQDFLQDLQRMTVMMTKSEKIERSLPILHISTKSADRHHHLYEWNLHQQHLQCIRNMIHQPTIGLHPLHSIYIRETMWQKRKEWANDPVWNKYMSKKRREGLSLLYDCPI